MPSIRISDKVYADLKVYAEADNRSISNAAEFLLGRSGIGRQNNDNYVGVTMPDLPPSPKITEVKTPKNNFEATPKVDDLFHIVEPVEVSSPVRPDIGELECCKHPTRPCKHWVWDVSTGDGYRNTLSGRYREAD